MEDINKLIDKSILIFNRRGEEGNFLCYDAETDLFSAWGRLQWTEEQAIEYLNDFIEYNQKYDKQS